MSKVITFSRFFPKGHPKAGQPTYFVEKIWESIYLDYAGWSNLHTLVDIAPSIYNHGLFKPKHHTIRAGHRFKVGDKFSPRVWSGKPYQSKQIIIAPDIEVKKVWDFQLKFDGDYLMISVNNWPFYEENSSFVTQAEALETLAENDGLTVDDMKSWFGIHPKKKGKDFDGQIICWNESVNY